MREIYILKCGDCPLYVRESYGPISSTGGKRYPQDCTHPASKTVPAELTLGGPEVMPHKCPMIRESLTYRAVLQRNPK